MTLFLTKDVVGDTSWVKILEFYIIFCLQAKSRIAIKGDA